jgi:uncharacterized Zn-finger protein
MTKHKKNKIQYECDLCGKLFARRNAIHTHMNHAHKSEGTKTCCFCNKKCKNKTALWHHRKIHSDMIGIKEKCKICSKEILITYMKKHMRLIHAAEKNEDEMQLCLVCGKMYKKKTFWFHQRIHTERKFICNFSGCTKKYFTENQLQQHEKTHRNQREHKCTFPGCSKSYFIQRGLRMHIALTHENFRESCPVQNCKFSVGRKDYMRAHIAKHTELTQDLIEKLLEEVKKKGNLW